MDETEKVGDAARAAADDLVVRTVQCHADSLLRLARRHSLCVDDAYDAYQRGLEIFLKHAPRLEAATAHQWLHTVVKREAWAVREQRQRMLGGDAPDLDQLEARDSPSPEDRALAFDDVARSAEALKRLKPQEVRALWLKASGRSYAEIADECGWTYTKVNRCITEGRRKFLDRYADIESGAECERWAPVLTAMVDGETDHRDLAQARPHLRNCPACRATVRALHEGSSSLAIVLPATLAIAGGSASPEATTSLFVRMYEAVAGTLHERAVASALKVQAALEAASVGKVTAVAASAAALAGGGAVVAETQSPSRPDRARQEAAASHPKPTRVAAAAVQGAMGAASPRGGAAAAVTKPPRAASGGGGGASKPRGTSGRRSRATRSVTSATQEFAPEGATSASTPAVRQALAASPRATTHPARPATTRSRSQSSAETEFTP
jgi:DNA-directed RNA polymerase specialized sigma24 family protein